MRRAASGAEVEHRLEIVLAVGLEGHERQCFLDSWESCQPLGYHRGQLLVLGHAQDGDEVPLAGDGVGLGDALDLGQVAAQPRQEVALGVDEDDRVRHEVKEATSRSSDSMSSWVARWAASVTGPGRSHSLTPSTASTGATSMPVPAAN